MKKILGDEKIREDFEMHQTGRNTNNSLTYLFYLYVDEIQTYEYHSFIQ